MNKDLFITYFLIGLVITSFVLNPFGKKKASKNLTSEEYFMINQVLITGIVIIYAIYLFSNNKCDINCLRKITTSQFWWAIFSAVIGVVGSIALIMLIQRDEITFIMPNIQPVVILIGAIIGYFFFSESMRKYKVIGIILILLGALSINYDKLKYAKPKN